MGRRLCCVLILLALPMAAWLPGAVHSASPVYRVFIPSAAGATPATAPRAPADDVVTLINERRRAAGCGEVQRDDTLASAAQRHSDDMARNDFMSHTGSDGSKFGQRARAAGYTFFASGEILAAGHATPAAAVEGWMKSSGHRDIMLDCANTDTGAALVERAGTQYSFYWTVVFGRR